MKSAMSPKDQVESDMLNQESNRPEDHTEVDSKGLEPHSQKVQKEGTMTSSVSPLGTPGTPPQDYRELTCQRLAGLFFSGRYEDRVWVESVAAYRDRIIVDGYQTDVVKTLKTVLRKAKKAVPGFAGIQRIGNEVSVLSNWTRSPPFGPFWFLVDAVIFHQSGFDLRVRILRSRMDHIDEGSVSSMCPNCKHNLQESSSQSPSSSTDPMNISDIAATLQRRFQTFFAPDEWWVRTKPYLTMENAVKCTKLLLLLVLAAATGVYHFAQNLLPALNKTLLALGTVIQKATPFLLACLDTVNKVIGATFLMIHRVWSDFYHGPRPQPAAAARRPALEMAGTRYWARQNITVRDNLTTGNLYLEGPDRPKYPYLRKDVNRPYLRE